MSVWRTNAFPTFPCPQTAQTPFSLSHRNKSSLHPHRRDKRTIHSRSNTKKRKSSSSISISAAKRTKQTGQIYTHTKRFTDKSVTIFAGRAGAFNWKITVRARNNFFGDRSRAAKGNRARERELARWTEARVIGASIECENEETLTRSLARARACLICRAGKCKNVACFSEAGLSPVNWMRSGGVAIPMYICGGMRFYSPLGYWFLGRETLLVSIWDSFSWVDLAGEGGKTGWKRWKLIWWVLERVIFSFGIGFLGRCVVSIDGGWLDSAIEWMDEFFGIRGMLVRRLIYCLFWAFYCVSWLLINKKLTLWKNIGLNICWKVHVIGTYFLHFALIIRIIYESGITIYIS